MPENAPGSRRAVLANDACEILNVLAVEMNFNAGLAANALQLLDDATLGAMAAIEKWRDDCQPQVRRPTVGSPTEMGYRRRTGQKARASADGKESRAEARDKRSLQSLGMRACR